MQKLSYHHALRIASLTLFVTGAASALKASETSTLITSDTTPIHTSDLGVAVTTPAAGDLFLAFRSTGGQGASLSYIVNIGSDLTYRNAAAGSTFIIAGIGDIGADLESTYGSGWSSRSDLFWGVFGARQAVSSTVYASKEQDPGGSSWSPLTQTARNATATSIIDVISGIGGYTGAESTANSPVATLQTNSTSESSYNKQVSAAGTTDFGSLSQWSSIEGNFGDGAAGTALDLYRIAGTQAANLGSFTIAPDGALSFSAVPEPGSAALLLGAVGLAGLRRRRG